MPVLSSMNTQESPIITEEHARQVLASLIKTDEKGHPFIHAQAILNTDWPVYRMWSNMQNLPTVDRVIGVDPSPYSLSYWLMKDISMRQTMLLWLSCSALLIASALNNPGKLSSAVIGFMTWTVIEYAYHRFVGHMPVINEFTKQSHFYLHGKHHFAPRDLDHVLLPPAVVFLSAIAVHQFIFSHITKNPEVAIAFSILHYLLYDLMHYSIHKFGFRDVSGIPMVGSLLVNSWANHIGHHRDPNNNYLVTMGGVARILNHHLFKPISDGVATKADVFSSSDKTPSGVCQR